MWVLRHGGEKRKKEPEDTGVIFVLAREAVPSRFYSSTLQWPIR